MTSHNGTDLLGTAQLHNKSMPIERPASLSSPVLVYIVVTLVHQEPASKGELVEHVSQIFNPAETDSNYQKDLQ
jgi:hypothetical protein